MKVGIFANDQQQEELLTKSRSEDTELKFVNTEGELLEQHSLDAIFIFNELSSYNNFVRLSIPVFINSVDKTLKTLDLPDNFHRLNGWNEFIKREVWEIASNDFKSIDSILGSIGWKYQKVEDVEGFISARVISLIVNEAYLAFEEGVSSKENIDTAMRLGTNYPYGPFEWGKRIGIKKIYDLLNTLSQTDVSYVPSQKLLSEI
ncbi:MAG: hypothetical protein NVSMB45_02560 [Ginsengibacter sp.]